MGRYTNLVTGKKFMTEQNALRHYISKAKKARKGNDYSEMWKIYSEATEIIDVDYCYKCSQDDFGYCGLRKDKISNEERFMNYCFDGFIRDMEFMLNNLREEYGKE